MGYGFVNFRTSASCDEFISRSMGKLLVAANVLFFYMEMFMVKNNFESNVYGF